LSSTDALFAQEVEQKMSNLLAGLARLFPERPKRSAHLEPAMIPFKRKFLPWFVSNMPG
jgi:hypothetical protein